MSRSARLGPIENSSLFNIAIALTSVLLRAVRRTLLAHSSLLLAHPSLFIGLTSVLRWPRACELAVGAAAAIGLFGLQALADWRAPAQSTRAQAARLALYIPFFAAAPPVVYPYTQVSFLLLLPVFSWMSRTGVASRFAQFGFVIGFLLTATQATAWADLTGRPAFDLLPSMGTLLVLTACTAAKREWMRPNHRG